MEKLKVLIADHSVVNRKNMTDLVNDTELGQVIKSASSGSIALEWLMQCVFDVIFFDVVVVKEIGVDQISEIKRNYPGIEIIIMSNNDEQSAELTLESMNRGALDFIMRIGDAHTSLAIGAIRSELEALFTQIKVRQYLPRVTPYSLPASAPIPVAVQKKFMGDIDLVLIASSTGGPVALEEICKHLPLDFPKPILVVQHMPPEFTHVLANSLDKKYRPSITEGKAGDLIQAGKMIIAPGGYHMIVEEGFGKSKAIKLLDTPFVNGVKPAADVLFQSVAETYKGMNILVIVLTGMGNDGTRGIKALKSNCNCYCMTQSEKTCVVYGMPKCVFDAGLSDEVVDLDYISTRINQMVVEKGGG